MKSPIKVTYIVSGIEKSLAFEWIVKYSDSERIELSFILLDDHDTALGYFLQENHIKSKRIFYRGKQDVFSAIYKVAKQLREWGSDVVHTHLFDANIVGLIAAKICGISKRILTRHHSTFHHDYYPRAVYYDKFTNALATKIVAISEVVKNVLVDREGVKEEKISLIHHGFDLKAIEDLNLDSVNRVRKDYDIFTSGPVIGIIARQTFLKGIQYVIPAIQSLRKKYPELVLVLANAQGDYQAEIERLLISSLPISAFRQIKFEKDLSALYAQFDIYVHVPIDPYCEAFGQTYVEALAARIPSVFTLSGVANEFIRNEYNALVVPFKDSGSISKAIERLLDDKILQKNITENGYKDVNSLFGINSFIMKLQALYLN
ncbi:glycosyltransferase family 4 protein [Hymenobacter taeanensis]|uniref:Glycosyltransferase family 4 protein n=1 Tax=Hymenobacter taeanensis TaxID=2735321 RepID=A0A6M6BI25_9BACT|nr:MULTISPECIES: glycosyltransferase family 4 protein [Hymenobacter]QJX47558.1 glycosyltransferase family 4 protein [Hymenobacter taeanensis]UOQ82958.1 glycosyltransferase family 4 protein [Hymenobacter sp. 5414T-23]